MRLNLLPKEPLFYKLLSSLATNTHEGARCFLKLIETWGSHSTYNQQLEEIEHTCDKIVHEIMVKLNTTFVTPIDREDIHHLAKTIDDVIDIIESLSKRMMLFQIQSITADLKEMAVVLEKAISLVVICVEKIRDLKNPPEILKHCIEIHTFENQGDQIFERAFAALFQNDPNPLDVIKWKEIYNFIESAIDKCEDIADIIWGITNKYG